MYVSTYLKRKHIVEPIDFIFTALFRYNSHTITIGTFKYTESVIFSVFKVVQPPPLANIVIAPQRSPGPIRSHSLAFPLPSLTRATTNLLSMGLPVLDGSCKCNGPIDVCGVFDYSVTLVVLHNGKMYAVHQLNECDETISLAEEFHICPL